jgi:hypothetical protein
MKVRISLVDNSREEQIEVREADLGYVRGRGRVSGRALVKFWDFLSRRRWAYQESFRLEVDGLIFNDCRFVARGSSDGEFQYGAVT